MRKRILFLCGCVCSCLAIAGGTDFPPPCNPVAVKKPVKVVRREIKVSIIGANRPHGPADISKATAESCFAYWKGWMDREIANKPDLVVLPEGVLSYGGYGPSKKLVVVQRCGDRLLKMFQAYAREHSCYLSFNAYRQRPDGRFANTSFFLDREGDVIAVYDKVYPTPGEIEWRDFPIVPGEGPVLVDTDFGRVGFATCFDLNFRDLIEAYAKEKPDVICFQSAYDGDFWRRVWSYTCRAYLIGCTVGGLAKEIDGPSGEIVMHSHNYFYTSTTKINTNCRVIHLDDNWGGIQRAIDKYGDRFEMRNPGAVGAVTVLSHDPAKPIDDIIREFGLVLWDDYYDRSVRLRGVVVKTDAAACGIPSAPGSRQQGASVRDAVASDVVRPVRQGGVNGQAYWNERSVMFMHPPSFDFKKVEGAVKYRYVVEDDARQDYRFEADTPNETLARIWPRLPDGMLRLEVLAIGRKGRPIGLSGYRRFWKSPAFDPSICPKSVCGYADAAAKYYDWLWNTPMVQSYLTNGVPCEDYVYSSFPSKTDGAIVRALVKYAAMRPERAAESLSVARRAADFLISLMQPEGSPLEHFPPTYRILKPAKPFGHNNGGADEIAKRYIGQNMIVYPAMVASAFLDLYEAVGEAKYLEAAKRIAGTYVKLQGGDGTWYLKLNEKDGTPVAQNRLFPLNVCSLMERLFAITGNRMYRETADRGFAYVDNGPLTDWNWEAQYEDVEPSSRFRNLTVHTPVQTAMYLLRRYPEDPERRAQARECLRFAEDQFVAWKPPFRADGTGPLGTDTSMIVKGDASAWFQVPGAFEQYDWYLPIDSAAAKMIGGYLGLYKVEGSLVDLAKAKSLGDAITIMQKKHGKGGAIPTHWLKWEVGPDVDTQPWINCGIATANALADLAAAVADASKQKKAGHE